MHQKGCMQAEYESYCAVSFLFFARNTEAFLSSIILFVFLVSGVEVGLSPVSSRCQYLVILLRRQGKSICIQSRTSTETRTWPFK